MQARLVGGGDLAALLDPAGPAWRGHRPEALRLTGTPSGMQPTAAVRASWPDGRIGAIGAISVDAAHDGTHLAFRLEWQDANEDRAIGDTTAFPDGAAVLLPTVPGAPVITMGAPGRAVNAWYWRADEEEAGRQVVAEGLGTTRTVDHEQVRTRAIWKEGRWSVVIARALRVESEAPVAQLAPGLATGYAVVVWEGSRGERAGIKSYSGDWRPLALAPLPQGRK